MKKFIILITLITFMTSCDNTPTEVDSVEVDTVNVDTTLITKDSVKTDTTK
jgi:hypothetical protein